jgi:hypothetical protein
VRGHYDQRQQRRRNREGLHRLGTPWHPLADLTLQPDGGKLRIVSLSAAGLQQLLMARARELTAIPAQF